MDSDSARPIGNLHTPSLTTSHLYWWYDGLGGSVVPEGALAPGIGYANAVVVELLSDYLCCALCTDRKSSISGVGTALVMMLKR